jgi:hypothetical protein
MSARPTPEEAGRELGRQLGPLPDALVHQVLDIVDAARDDTERTVA